MKTSTLITLITLALTSVTTSSLMAQSAGSSSQPTAQNRGKNLTPEQRKKILKKFDKDGDGKLNTEEAAAARAALLARKARTSS